MMIQEFTEITKYTPTAEEYHYIEESYYEADTVLKSEFCKQWLKDKKSGKWDMEYKLRRRIDEQKTEYEEQLRQKEEDLSFYRTQFKIGMEARNKLKEIQNILK